MRILTFLAAFAAMLPAPVLAEGFSPVTSRDDFVQLVDGRDLRISAYGLTLQVLPDGQITGVAMGRDVSGSWAWKDGYFCREMAWGKREISYNCQLVEVRDGGIMRFTVDQGRGQSADFRLR